MDLQSLFYIVAIVFMLMFISGFVFLGIFLWRLERTIRSLPETAASKVRAIAEQYRSGITGTVGTALLTFVVNRVKRKFQQDDES